MAKVYTNVNMEQSREIINLLCGEKHIYEHYIPRDKLMCFFLEEPDDEYLNYFALKGNVALVIYLDRVHDNEIRSNFKRYEDVIKKIVES